MASNVPPGAQISDDGFWWWSEERQEWMQVYDDGVPEDGSQMSHDPSAAAAPDPAAGVADPAAHSALTPTDAQAEQVPASFAVGGLPAFEFQLPEMPIAHVALDTGTAMIEVELALSGKVELSFPEHESAATIGTEGLKLAAEEAVHGVREGISVTGLGSGHAAIESSFGNQFGEGSISLEGNTIKVQGAATYTYTYHGSYGTPVQAKGSGGYTLKVTVVPHGAEPAPEVDNVESWFEAHQTVLIAAGVLVLIGVAGTIAIVATGGAATPAVAAAAAVAL